MKQILTVLGCLIAGFVALFAAGLLIAFLIHLKDPKDPQPLPCETCLIRATPQPLISYPPSPTARLARCEAKMEKLRLHIIAIESLLEGLRDSLQDPHPGDTIPKITPQPLPKSLESRTPKLPS